MHHRRLRNALKSQESCMKPKMFYKNIKHRAVKLPVLICAPTNSGSITVKQSKENNL
jgi:hypothetical protein